MLAAILHGISLILALNVQTMQTPILGAWLLFLLGGSAASYKFERFNLVWYGCVAWLATLGISTFILAPVPNGAVTMWVLAAMPITALAIRKEHLEYFLKVAFIVIFIYAIGLILQMVFRVHYTGWEYYIPWRDSYATAWPLVDPNNAAAVLNMALIPTFYMALRKPKYFVLFGYLAFALMVTASRMGALAAGAACFILLVERYGKKLIWLSIALPLLELLPLSRIFHDTVTARLDMWQSSFPLLGIRPFTGLGLGTYSFYYNQIRTEKVTGGWFAHNDFLQLAIEMGLPAIGVLLFLVVAVIRTTNRATIVSACVLLAFALQALTEFQFYVPAVSMLAGLALAYHRHRHNYVWLPAKADV